MLHTGISSALRVTLSAVPAGAAALISLTSLLLAIKGGGDLWISAPLKLGRAWHLFVAATFAIPLLPRGALLPYLRRIPRFAITILLVVATFDVLCYYTLLRRGAIQSSFPVPLSIPLTGLLLWCRVRLRLDAAETRPAHAPLSRLVGLATGALLLTLTLLLTFGSTDYRRPADCAIILGAGVRADGTPSLALSDRVNEGIRLFKAGLVDRLIMTGGVDRNGWSEPDVMKRMAVAAAVPPEAILTDPTGVDTKRSAEGCRDLMAREGLRTALIVSHYYHLARCRMTFELAGIASRTVPARMTRRLAREPYYILRECAGFLAYLLPRRR